MPQRTRSETVRRIIERTDLESFAERVLESFWERPEFQRLRPPREQVLAWVRWNLDLVNRWLIEGRAPSEGELDVFRQQARARAADGTPPDIVPANFRRAARFAWGALLNAATKEERPALLESADLLFEYVDRVTRIFSDVYETAAKSTSAVTRESAARALMGRIERDEPPDAEDYLIAEQLGFELDRAARPFIIASPGQPAQYHAALAARLRGRGALVTSEGRRVVGLSNRRLDWVALELDADAIYAEGPPAIRGERGRSLDELRTVANIATIRRDTGRVAVDDYLPELLLQRSPRIASRVRARVYGPLDSDYPELAHTLDLLVQNGFERGPTAAALPVHRNTLRDRINRISEITAVDLSRVEGRGLAWLAWLERTAATANPVPLGDPARAPRSAQVASLRRVEG
jgi:hypothetical protein